MAAEYTELVTKSLVRDVALPLGAGTMALITLDNGADHTKPTSFGMAGITQLREAVAAIGARVASGEIAAVGVTGKPYYFLAGADLRGMPVITTHDVALSIGQAGHAAYSAIMDLDVPTFAFVNGAALGGGMELALACDYRAVSASVSALALPETFLGLVPGWGGAYGLPRLIGAEAALSVIIDNPAAQNRMLNAKAAAELGIMDAVFEPADFLAEAIRWAARVITGAEDVLRAPVDFDDEASWNAACEARRAAVLARSGGEAHGALRALDLVQAARTAERGPAFAAEDEALADLIMDDTLRASLYAFDLVQRRAKRPAGAPDAALARPVTKVGIVGAGLMASQLALLFVRRLKVPVVMTDLDQARVDAGVARVHQEIETLATKGKISADKAAQLTSLVTGATSNQVFSDANFVIEAVFEELSVKQQVFAELEKVVEPTCVLASNTSSLSIGAMAAGLAHPERVVGFHFFNPVAVMPLLEIAPSEATDDESLATAFAVGKALGKTTIRVKDSASFVVNRLLGRYLGEFSRIVDEGTALDVANRGVAGLAPMPPFALLGLVGPTIALHNNESLQAAFGDRFYVSPWLKAIVESGIQSLIVEADGRPTLNPEAAALFVPPSSPTVLDSAQVRERILSALAEEVAIMLKDEVVVAPMDIDLAMITGAGFPFWNGGLIPLLDREGLSQRVIGARILPPGVASVPS